MKPDFILASQSPRRKMLLECAGLSPRIVVSDADESPRPGEPPVAYGLRVAIAKASAVAGARVLAADTVVALDAEILAKAADPAEATAMLSKLSGRTHAVHTAVVLVLRDGERERRLEDIVTSTVRFRSLTDAEIRRYVETGEWIDKAGAYGIQGAAGALVADVHGSYTNIVGLPLEETLRLLRLGGVE